MGSRIKENPERIFDGFFEFLRPVSLDADPVLKRQFPEHLDDQESVPALAHFCFPFDIERWDNSSVQHFSFTLTDLQGYQRLGFCRLSIRAKSCLCILSCLPWFELFYKLLNNIAEYNAKEQFSEMEELLQSLYKHPVPEVNTALSLETLSHFITPDPSRLPSIPENRNLTEFLVAVHVDTMLQLYSSLLFERRILITCSKLSTLTACVHASAALLYPMYWQHIYIPTLPPHLLDYIGAPMPYLIGVHSSLMEKMNIKSMEDVVIFNMDTNYLETPFQDLQNLPSNLVSQLKLRLRKQTALMGDGVSRVFLRAQAMLFGGYRDALLCTPGEPVSFCQESFLNNKCSAMKSFLQSAVHLQLFAQFIDSRLEKLNAGDGFTDIFEQEITNCGLSGNSKSYQLWLDNLKKGGGSLINNVKSRAHPAVRNMLRYAKGQAKSGLQGMRSRIKQKDHRHFHRGGSLRGDEGPTQNHAKLQSRLPITQHFGQSRPRRPGKRYTDNDSYDSQRSAEDDSTEQTEGGPEAVEDFPLMEDHGMDLLEEIFETLNTRAPGEECALYGTHSLDFFNLDDNQYFTRFQSINQTSEEDLSMSQPRDSSLWYLQEEDEGSLDQTEISSELTSLASESMSLDIENPSQNAHDIPEEDASPLSEVTPSTRNIMTHEASSTTSNDASATEKTTSLVEEIISPDEEAKSSTKEVASPTMTTETQVSEAKSTNIDITPPSTDNELVIDDVTSQMTDTSSPTPVSDGSPTVIEKGKTTEHPSPNQMEETAENANTTSAGASYDAPGPCRQASIARVQKGPLDPRLMWPGTKREAAQKVMEFINQQQNNTPPTSNRKSGAQTLHSVPKTHSGLQLKTQPDFCLTVNSPKPLHGHSTSMATGTKECTDDGVSQKSAEFVPLSLTKVSELKKRFEV